MRDAIQLDTLVTMSRRHSNAAKAHHKATDPERYVSVPRAATLLGVTRNTVYQRIARGELQGEHIAGRLVVVRQSLPSPASRTGAR